MQTDSLTTWDRELNSVAVLKLVFLVHASLNRPMLCFNIVWIPPDVKATFPELLLWQGTMQWVNEKKHKHTEKPMQPFYSVRGATSGYQYWRHHKPSLITINLSKWLFSLCPVSPLLLLLLLHFIHTFYLPKSLSLSLIPSFTTTYVHAFFFLPHFFPLLSQLFALCLSSHSWCMSLHLASTFSHPPLMKLLHD